MKPKDYWRILMHWLWAQRLRASGVTLGPGYRLAANIHANPGGQDGRPGRIDVGIGCWFEEGVVLHGYGGRINLGNNVFLGPYSVVYGHGGVSIGHDCLIAMHCRILSSNHTIAPQGTPIREQPDVLLPTKIGRDVWLGAGVTVLGGVTLGNGCIVGAGAVVTKNLPPGAIAHGVPARIVGWRDGAAPPAP